MLRNFCVRVIRSTGTPKSGTLTYLRCESLHHDTSRNLLVYLTIISTYQIQVLGSKRTHSAISDTTEVIWHHGRVCFAIWNAYLVMIPILVSPTDFRQPHDVLATRITESTTKTVLDVDDGPLVWIDCEMTGSDPRSDKIMEIAVREKLSLVPFCWSNWSFWYFEGPDHEWQLGACRWGDIIRHQSR